MIDVSQFKRKSLELAQEIVEQFDISFTPGIAFGNAMDSYLRMCFATSSENIERAVEALKKMEQWKDN